MKEKVDYFYDQLQFEIDKTCKQNVTGDWNPKIESMKEKNVVEFYGLRNQN